MRSSSNVSAYSDSSALSVSAFSFSKSFLKRACSFDVNLNNVNVTKSTHSNAGRHESGGLNHELKSHWATVSRYCSLSYLGLLPEKITPLVGGLGVSMISLCYPSRMIVFSR